MLGGLNKNRYGVYEDPPVGKTAHVVALDNNDFWSAGTPRNDFAYRSWNGTTGSDVMFAQIGALSGSAPLANLNVDPLLDATWHLGATSPGHRRGHRDGGAEARSRRRQPAERHRDRHGRGRGEVASRRQRAGPCCRRPKA